MTQSIVKDGQGNCNKTSNLKGWYDILYDFAIQNKQVPLNLSSVPSSISLNPSPLSIENDYRVHLQLRQRTTTKKPEEKNLSIQVRSERTSYWIDVWNARNECS